MRGPIDYIIVGFEGNKFNGSVLQALKDAIDKGIISVLALALVQKDSDGTVKIADIASLGDGAAVEFIKTYNVDDKLVTQEDRDEIAELIEPNTAVGLLVIEQLWAKPLKKALIEANGVLVAEGRIHPDAAFELNKEEK